MGLRGIGPTRETCNQVPSRGDGFLLQADLPVFMHCQARHAPSSRAWRLVNAGAPALGRSRQPERGHLTRYFGLGNFSSYSGGPVSKGARSSLGVLRVRSACQCRSRRRRLTARSGVSGCRPSTQTALFRPVRLTLWLASSQVGKRFLGP